MADTSPPAAAAAADAAAVAPQKRLLEGADGIPLKHLKAGPPLLQLIESRHCTHSFDPARAVPREVVDSILRAARNCPSTNNTQPWTTIVAQGETRDALVKGMLAKFDAGDNGSASYKNRPAEMPGRMVEAGLRYGKEFYGGHFALARDNKEARRAWGAPLHLVLCCPSNAVAGTFLDMGSFMTSILLGAHAHGLGAKPQFSVAKYHDVCRAVLGDKVLPPDLQVVCGLSIGWTADG